MASLQTRGRIIPSHWRFGVHLWQNIPQSYFPMHAARWSVFFCLLGLTALIPAYFIPAMLVANAVDGSRWLSVWSGIETFWQRGHYFLAGLIFCFSLVFPLVKFGLCLIVASGGSWLPDRVRQRVITLTEWTAKYSMLDVFVIAMLILLVKVDQFILMLPSAGLYLFSFAVFCSVIASGFLRAAFKQPDAAPKPEPIKRHRFRYLPWLIAGAAVAVCGLTLLAKNLGGSVNQVTLTNLTKRPIPRTMEKLIGLRELGKEEHDFWSMDTLKRLTEAFQAATTDAGWSDAQGYLVIETLSGRTLQTAEQALSFDDPNLTLTFTLPETLLLADIGSVELKSKVKYVKLLPVEASEERVAVANDTFRAWTMDWYGRIFQFQWAGPPNHEFTGGIVLASLGLIACYWAGSGLICGGRRIRLVV
jgi:paraquat-inducible protein A